MTSPRLEAAAASTRTESEVRADRRAKLEADMRREGFGDAAVARLATDEVAGQMLAHERAIVAKITSLLGGA